MQDLQVVAEARKLLQEAQGWWLLTWAREENKARVRKLTDEAREALNAQVQKARRGWSEEVTHAYEALAAGGAPGTGAAQRAARAVAEAESEFNRVTALARQTFAEAEREMNAGKARTGARQAIEAIDRHEEFVAAARAAAGK